jgi:alpha-tubulin suppressor-like RCC1 family protein
MSHSLAISHGGDGWGWGLNDFGQVGTGANVTPILVPEAIRMP